MNDYPEHRKLSKIQKDSQVCGEFLDWLENELGVVVDACFASPDLLNEYFDIDSEALEAEKQAMLRATREATSEPSAT